jgi:hypothetical protein
MVGVKLEPARMIDLCLAENERRMSGYDQRLLREHSAVPGAAGATAPVRPESPSVGIDQGPAAAGRTLVSALT